jgi:Ca-activated chloride channel homolog
MHRPANSHVSFPRINSVLLIGIAAFWCLVLVSSGFGTEDPDDLYRNGQYLDAERIYRLKDMDRPEDIRYRYNRGCALYRLEAYQGAAMVFSSVLKNAGTDDVRFRAAYNLGNMFYMSRQFASAVKFYKKAVAWDPDNEDARYNLELSLWRLNRKKQENPPPEKDRQDKRKPSQSQNNPNMQSPGGVNKKGQAQNQQDQPEQADSDDLSGELKPMANMPELQNDSPLEGPDKPNMDEKKAQAFLDNVKENRTQFQQSRISRQKRNGARSRKDW